MSSTADHERYPDESSARVDRQTGREFGCDHSFYCILGKRATRELSTSPKARPDSTGIARPSIISLMKAQPARRLPPFLLPSITLLAIALGLAVWPGASRALFYLTGEEKPLPQTAGVTQLAFNLVRPALQLANDVPVDHAGVNPFGVNTFLQNEADPHKRRLAMEMVANAGFHWIRQEFPWEDIEIHGPGDFVDRRHDPPRSSWEKYDQIVDLAEAYGIEIIARLSNPPAWSRAAGDQAGTFAPPDDLDAYGDFVEAVVRRYKGRIHYYQIWNEPNIYPEWGEQPVDAAEYVELLKVGYTRAKAVDPDVVIIAGALAATIELDRYPRGLTDALFLQQMYDAGAAPYFDVLAMQGYGLWSGPYDRRMQPRVLNFSRPLYIRDVMVRNGDAHKPIWLSELAWNALPPNWLAAAPYGQVTEAQQARYAVLAYHRLQSEWPWLGVANYWFLKQADDRERDNNPQYYFRLLEPDFTPQPVYQALSDAAHLPPVMYRGYHQEDHWAVTYACPTTGICADANEGGWQKVKDERAVLGAYRQATTDGASISFTFDGSDLWLVVTRQPGAGQLEVTIDGSPPTMVLLDASDITFGARVLVARGLLQGEHHVRITARLDAEHGHGPVIDGFIVERRPTGWLRREVGAVAMVVSFAALGWLILSQRRHTR
jgi:hypothetical protein